MYESHIAHSVTTHRVCTRMSVLLCVVLWQCKRSWIKCHFVPILSLFLLLLYLGRGRENAEQQKSTTNQTAPIEKRRPPGYYNAAMPACVVVLLLVQIRTQTLLLDFFWP